MLYDKPYKHAECWAGCDVEHGHDNWTCLHHACLDGNHTVEDSLSDDTNAPDKTCYGGCVFKNHWLSHFFRRLFATINLNVSVSIFFLRLGERDQNHATEAYNHWNDLEAGGLLTCETVCDKRRPERGRVCQSLLDSRRDKSIADYVDYD